MRAQALPALSALSAGLMLAVYQVGYFITLEFHLSSTYIAYFAVLGVWLLGSLIGLWLPRSTGRWPLIGAGMAAYYANAVLFAVVSYNLLVLPLSLLCVLTTGLYGGYFFRQARRDFPSARVLFFHENNGFLVGYFVAFAQLLFHGQTSLRILPGLLAASHIVVQVLVERSRLSSSGQAPAS